MTPTRWLAVITLAITLVSLSFAGCSIDDATRTSQLLPNKSAVISDDGVPQSSLKPTKRDAPRSGGPMTGTTSRVELQPIAPHTTARLTRPEANEAAPRKYNDALDSSLNDGPSLPILQPVPTLLTPVPSTPATIEFKPIQVNDPPRLLPSRAPSKVHGAMRPMLGTPQLVEVQEVNSERAQLVNARIGTVEVLADVSTNVNSPEPLAVLPLTAPRIARPVNSVAETSDDGYLWWDEKVTDPMRQSATPKTIGLEDMILGALRHSPRVRAISDTPLIRETAIMESQGQFDWRAFMESRFTDTSDPVGSTLTTGGPKRLIDQNWRYSSGLQRKMYSGGKLEIAQRIGLEDSNSQFFSPTNQANSKLSLNFTQPLLNGAGRAYNTSLILLAQIDTDAAHDEFSRQLQNHLLEVTRTYWELFLNRAVLLQKRQVHAQAVQILEELESRRAVDSLESQIVRARAAVATRQAEIVRSEMAIRNTESKLRVLVHDPELIPNDHIELLPTESPSSQPIQVNLADSLATAMQHRPEIDQATKNVRAATVRLGISKNELQPVLDFVAETYASGLEGDFALGKSYGNQFSEGRPSYSVGLVFEVPLCNRAARARYQRRQLELDQLAHELQNVIETTKAEVEIAVREVETSFREMQGKLRAVTSTAEEVRYLRERWKLLPGEDQVASFLLEDLLDAQDRLADAEFDMVSAQVSYTLSVSELKRAMGTLLEAEEVEAIRAYEDGRPTMRLDKLPRNQLGERRP